MTSFKHRVDSNLNLPISFNISTALFSLRENNSSDSCYIYQMTLLNWFLSLPLNPFNLLSAVEKWIEITMDSTEYPLFWLLLCILINSSSLQKKDQWPKRNAVSTEVMSVSVTSMKLTNVEVVSSHTFSLFYLVLFSLQYYIHYLWDRVYSYTDIN